MSFLRILVQWSSCPKTELLSHLFRIYIYCTMLQNTSRVQLQRISCPSTSQKNIQNPEVTKKRKEDVFLESQNILPKKLRLVSLQRINMYQHLSYVICKIINLLF